MPLSFYMRHIINEDIIYLDSDMVKNTVKFMEFKKTYFQAINARIGEYMV